MIKNTEKIKSGTKEDIERLISLELKGRTEIEYLLDWINDLDDIEEEFTSVYLLQKFVKILRNEVEE